MSEETEFIDLALCYTDPIVILPRMCPKCGTQVNVSGFDLRYVVTHAIGCPDHNVEVQNEIDKGYSMWPSDWFGKIYQKRSGEWENHFEWMVADE